MVSPQSTFWFHTMPWFHNTRFESIVLQGRNALANHVRPTATPVSMARDNVITPLALRPPAPWVSASYVSPVAGSVRFTAVNSSTALMAFGLKGGRTLENAVRLVWMASAATPLATPAAILVPLNA